MDESDDAVRRILRHILTNLTSGIITTETSQQFNDRTYQDSMVPVPSPSPHTMGASAISDSVTISTNPSMALTSPAVTSTTKPDQHVYNSTGYLVEQDELEYSILAAFSDMQTVFLACFATLVPLIVAVAIVFGLRHAWRKYRHRRNGSNLPWYRGVCSRGDTPDSLHHRPHSGSITIQPATRILSAQDFNLEKRSEVTGFVEPVRSEGQWKWVVNSTTLFLHYCENYRLLAAAMVER